MSHVLRWQWPLHRVAAAFAATLACAACSVAGQTRPVHIELARHFSLKPGGSAQTSGGALRIGFDRVTADSRCPRGEQCIRAGDATARFWLQHATGPRQTLDLNTDPDGGQSMRVQDHHVRLVRLDPEPVSGRAVTQADYVATLTVTRDAGN